MSKEHTTAEGLALISKYKKNLNRLSKLNINNQPL